MENIDNTQQSQTDPSQVQSSQEQSQEPQASTVKPKYIDIYDAMQRGATYRDLYEAEKSTGYAVRPPTREELMANYSQFKNDPERADAVLKQTDAQYRLYKSQQWDPMETTVGYSSSGPFARAMAKTYNQPQGNEDVNDFKQRSPDYGVTDPSAGFIQTETGDKVASERGTYIDMNGGIQPMSKAANAKGYLEKQLSLDGNTFYWKEQDPDKLIMSNMIKGNIDRDLSSNSSWTAAARNLWYGFGPSFIKSVASGVFTVGTLVNKMTGDDTPTEQTGSYKTFSNWTNWANAHSAQNVDETKAYFDNFTSFLSQTANVLGNLANMAAFTAATSGAGVMAIKGMQLGETAASTAMLWNTRVATQAGLLLGDFMVMGGFQEQMIDSGIDAATAVRWSLPYGITSHMAFTVLPLTQSMGPKLLEKGLMKSATGGADKLVSKDIIKLFKDDIGESYIKILADETADKATKRSIFNRAYNMLSKGKEYLTEIETKPGVMAHIYKAGAGATATTVQITAANFAHTRISGWLNGTLGVWAEKYDNTFGKYDIVPNPDNGTWTDEIGQVRGSGNLPYKLVNKKNPKDSSLISEAEKEDFDKKRLLSKRILSGDKVLNEDFKLSDGYSMFFSSMIGLGIGGVIGSFFKQEERKASIIDMAYRCKTDDKYYAKFKSTIQDMVTSGQIQKNYMTKEGEIIKDGAVGKSEGGEVVGTLLKDVERYIDIIDRYKLNTDKFKYVTQNLPTLVREGVSIAENIDNYQKALAEFNEKGSYTDQEGVTKGLDKDGLENKIKDRTIDLTNVVEVKKDQFLDPKDKTIKQTKSLRYTDLFLSGEIYDFAVKRFTEEEAKRRLTIKDDDPQYKQLLDAKMKEVTDELADKKNKGTLFTRLQAELVSKNYIALALAQYDHENKGTFIRVLKGIQDDMIKEHNNMISAPVKDRTIIDTGSGTTMNLDAIVSSVNELVNQMGESDVLALPTFTQSVMNAQKAMNLVSHLIEGSTAEAFPERDTYMQRMSDIGIKIDAILGKVEESRKGIADEDPFHSTINPLLNTLGVIKNTMGDIKSFKPMELTTFASDITKTFKQTPEGIRMQSANGKSESFDMLFNHMINNVEKEPGRRTQDLQGFIDENAPMEDRVIADPEETLKSAEEFKGLLNIMSEFVRINKEFFQDEVEAKPEMIEHTKLYSNDARISKEELVRLQGEISWRLKTLDDIIDLAGKSKEVRELDNNRIAIHDIGVHNWLLNFIFDQTKVNDGLLLAIGNINKILRDAGYLQNEDTMTSIDNLWSDFYNNKDKRDNLRKNVIDKLELEIVRGFDALGGKLKEFEKSWISKYSEKKNVYSYIKTKDLTDGTVIDFSTGGELSGMYSAKSLAQGILDISNDKGEGQNSAFAKSYILSMVHRINQYGETGKGDVGSPLSYSEILQANKKWNKQKQELIKSVDVFDSSIEQQRVIHHAVSFALSPNTDYIIDTHTKNGKVNKDSFYEHYIPNSMVIRGYTGVGKSTQIPTDIIGTTAIARGKAQKVLIVVPSDFYKDSYTALAKKIQSKLEGGTFDIVYKKDFVDRGVANPYDMIFFEEGAYLSKEEIVATKRHMGDIVKKNPETALYFLADDTQIPPRDGKGWASYIYQFGERTVPVIMTRRTGLKVLSNLMSELRVIRNKEGITVTQAGFEEVNGYKRGIMWHGREEDVIKEFQQVIDKMIEEGKTPTSKDICLVVYDQKMEDDLIQATGLGTDAEKYRPFIKHIYIDETDSRSQDKFVGGINSEKVFFPMDVTKKSDTRFYDSLTTKNAKAVSILLTIIGRASGIEGYFSSVNDTMVKENSTRKLVAFEQPSDYDITMRLKDLTDHLEMLTEGKDTFGAKIKEEPVTTEGDVVSLQNFKPTNVADEKIVEDKVGKETRDLLKEIPVDEKNKPKSVTDTIHDRLFPDGSKTSEEEKDATHNKNNSVMLRMALSTIIDPKNNTQEDFLKFLADNDKVFKIKEPEHFGMAMLHAMTYSPEFQEILKSSLTILKPELNNNGFQGHPLAMQIVGYMEADGEIKPIINIYDMAVYKVKPGDIQNASKLKMGVYAAMAQNDGMIVNEMRFFKWTKDGMKIAFHESQLLSPEEKTELTRKGFDMIGVKQEPVFATEGDMYTVEREIPFLSDPELSKASDGERYATWKSSGGNVTIEKLTRVLNKGKNDYDTFVYFKDYKGNAMPPMEKSLFMSTYKYSIPGKFQEKHVDTALRFVTDKVMWSSSGHDILFSQNPLFSIDVNDLWNVSDKKKNSWVRMRQIINKHVTTSLATEKRYMEEVKTMTGKTLRHVVINEIAEKFQQPFYEMVKGKLEKEYGKEITFEQAKENGLFVLSTDSAPEKDFGTTNKPLNFADSEIDRIISLDENTIDEEIDKLLENSYKGDKYETELKDLNAYRLKTIWHLARGGTYSSEVGEITEGNIIYDKSEAKAIPIGGKGNTLEGRGKTYNFKIAFDEDAKILSQRGKRKRVVGKLYRDSKDDGTEFLADGMKLRTSQELTDYLDHLIKQVEDYATNTDFVSKEMQLQKMLLGKGTAEEIRSLISQMSPELENLEAYKFLLMNEAFFERNAVNDKSLQNLVWQDDRGNIHLRPAGSLTIGKETVNTILNAKVEGLKRALNVLRDNAEHYANENVNDPDMLRKSIWGNNRKGFITENIETNATELTQKEFYIKKVNFDKIEKKPEPGTIPAKRTVKKVIRQMTEDGGIDFGRLNMSKEEARKQMMDILGDDYGKKLEFIDYDKIKNLPVDDQYYGNMINAISTFVEKDGFVNPVVARHESMHVITDFMLKPEAQERLLFDAKKRMIKDNLYDSIIDIKDDAAYEYLSKSFEYHKYNREQDFVTKVLNAVKYYVNKFTNYKIYFGTDRVADLYRNADNGFYRDHKLVNYGNWDTMRRMEVENDWTKAESIKYALNVFINKSNFDHIAINVVNPDLINTHSYFSKAMDSPVTNIFESINDLRQGFRDKSTEDGHNKTTGKAPQRQLFLIGEDGTVQKPYKAIQDITPEDYQRMKMFRVKDTGEMGRLNARTMRAYEIYHLQDDRVLYPILQSVMGNVDVRQLMQNEGKNIDAYSKMIFKIRGEDNNDTNPMGTQSEAVKMLLSSIPKWMEDNKGNLSRYDSNNHGYGYVETSLLHSLLIQAALNVKKVKKGKDTNGVDVILDPGTKFSVDAWMKEINTMAKNAVDIKQKTVLNSFLVEFGDKNVESGINDRLLVDLDGKIMLEGIGYHAIIKDYFNPLGSSIPDLFGLEHNDKNYAERIGYFTNVLNGFTQHFGSLYRKTDQIHELMKDDTIEKKRHVSKMETIANYNAKGVMELNLLSMFTGSVHKDIALKLTPGSAKQAYNITKEGLSKIEKDGSLTHVLSLKSSDISEAHALNILGFLGLEVFHSNLKSLRDPGKESYNQLGMDLYHALLSLRVNDMITKEVIEHRTNNTSTMLEHGDFDGITGGLYGHLISYYKKSQNRYEVENNTDSNGEKIPLPSPTDMYYFQRRVTEATKYNQLMSSGVMSRNVVGDPTYMYNRSSHLHDLFGKPINDQTPLSSLVADRIKFRIDNAKNKNFLNNETSLLAQGRFHFDDLDSHGGLKYINRGYKFEDLQAPEKWMLFMDSTIKQMLLDDKVVGGYALLDTLSDTTIYPVLEFNFQDKNGRTENIFTVSKRKDTNGLHINNISFNEKVFLNYVNTIKGYYDELKLFSQKRWDDMGGKDLTSVLSNSELGAKMKFNLVENRDYVIKKSAEGDILVPGNAITQPGNPFNDMENVTLKGVQKAFTGHMEEMAKKIGEASISLNEDAVEMFPRWKISSTIPDKVAKLVGTTITNSKTIGEASTSFGELMRSRKEARKELVSQKKTLVDSKQFIASENMNETIKTYDKETKSISNGFKSFLKTQSVEMRKQGFQQEGEYHPLIQAMFWNNYIINESINHATRGSDFMYKGFPDFVKRSKGIISPGEKFTIGNSWNYMQPESRVLALEDIWGHDPLFGDKDIELTNGMVPLNPLYHRAMFHDSGGVVGSLGDGSVKNVNHYYDQEDGRAVFIKSNSYPIHRTLVRNNKFYQDLTKMMMTPEIYDELMRQVKWGRSWNDSLDSILEKMRDPKHPWKFDSQIDYIVFKSTVKGNATKMHQLKNSIGANATFDDANIPFNMNHDDNVIRISNETLRYQTNQKMNAIGGTTSIPMQELHIMSFGHNEQGNINTNIKHMVDNTILFSLQTIKKKISTLDNKQALVKYIHGIISDYQLFNNRPDKSLQIIEDPTTSIDAIRRTAIQLLMTRTNSILRPRMKGSFMVQAPSTLRMYFDTDINGKEAGLSVPKFAEDLGFEHDGINTPGHQQRQLMPQGYDLIDEKGNMIKHIESREELASAMAQGRAKYRAAEMVAPWYHMKTFGFDQFVSLAEIMQYDSIRGRQSLYDYYHSRRNESDFKGQFLLDFRNMTASDIFSKWNDKVTTVLERQYKEWLTLQKFGGKDIHSADYMEYEKSLEDRGFFKDKVVPGDMKEDLKLDFSEFSKRYKTIVDDPNNIASFLSQYYRGINDSLDAFFVRIPTTNANMGFPELLSQS